MKSVEFTSTVANNGLIAIPPELARQLPEGEELRVVLVWGAEDDESAWRELGRRIFEAAYSPEDCVYDELMNDPPLR